MALTIPDPPPITIDQPITWIVHSLTDIAKDAALNGSRLLTETITPIVAILFGLYILLITINYLRGAETEPVIDFGLRMAGFSVVIGLGLSYETYSATVIPMVTELGNDIATVMTGGNAGSNALDTLATFYFKILSDGYNSANSPYFPWNVGPLLVYLLKALLVIVGLIPFLVAATVTIVVANVGSMLVAAVGPLFFAFLLFPATRQYFSSWINSAFSYALIPVFIAVIALISTSIAKAMFQTSGETLENVSFSAIFLATIGNLTLVYLVKQVSALASSLSAGGINAAMPSTTGTLGNIAKGLGGGKIERGPNGQGGGNGKGKINYMQSGVAALGRQAAVNSGKAVGRGSAAAYRALRGNNNNIRPS